MFVRVFLNSILVMKPYNIQKFACHAPNYSISTGLLVLSQRLMGNMRIFTSKTWIEILLSLGEIWTIKVVIHVFPSCLFFFFDCLVKLSLSGLCFKSIDLSIYVHYWPCRLMPDDWDGEFW